MGSHYEIVNVDEKHDYQDLQAKLMNFSRQQYERIVNDDVPGTAVYEINDEMDYEFPGMPDYKLFLETVDYEYYQWTMNFVDYENTIESKNIISSSIDDGLRAAAEIELQIGSHGQGVSGARCDVVLDKY